MNNKNTLTVDNTEDSTNLEYAVKQLFEKYGYNISTNNMAGPVSVFDHKYLSLKDDISAQDADDMGGCRYSCVESLKWKIPLSEKEEFVNSINFEEIACKLTFCFYKTEICPETGDWIIRGAIVENIKRNINV